MIISESKLKEVIYKEYNILLKESIIDTIRRLIQLGKLKPTSIRPAVRPPFRARAPGTQWNIPSSLRRTTEPYIDPIPGVLPDPEQFLSRAQSSKLPLSADALWKNIQDKLNLGAQISSRGIPGISTETKTERAIAPINALDRQSTLSPDINATTTWMTDPTDPNEALAIQHMRDEYQKQMTLPPPTTTPIDLETREKYFGPDPELAYRPGAQVSRWAPPGLEVYSPDPSIYGATSLKGSGAFRQIHDIPGQPDIILKMSHVGTPSDPTLLTQGDIRYSIRTREMNRLETLPEYQRSDLALKVYEAAPDYSWIKQEKAVILKNWVDTLDFFPTYKGALNLVAARGGSKQQYANALGYNLFSVLIAQKRPLTIKDLARGVADRRSLHTINKTPQIKQLEIFEMAKNIGGPLFPEHASDEVILDSINKLMSDSLLSNVRDLLRKVCPPIPGKLGSGKPAACTWDLRPGNLGFTYKKDPRTGKDLIDIRTGGKVKQFKLVDPGFALD